MKYTLLQLPALAFLILLLLILRGWIEISGILAILIVVLWVAKDMILFPFVWRAYDEPRRGQHPIIGNRGRTRETLNPSGHVQVGGELWKAEIGDGALPIGEGETILVVGIRGLTLLVKKEED